MAGYCLALMSVHKNGPINKEFAAAETRRSDSDVLIALGVMLQRKNLQPMVAMFKFCLRELY